LLLLPQPPVKGKMTEKNNRALRPVRVYYEKAEYIHLNPVRAGLVKRAEDWPSSSGHDYNGSPSDALSAHRVLSTYRALLRWDEKGRI